MSCIIKYKGKKYSEEQFKEYFINNKQEFATSIAKNKDVIDSFKRKMEGSKQDIEGFKKFIDQNNINQDLQNLHLTTPVLESLYENSSKSKEFITFVKDLKKMIAIWQNSGKTNEEILEMIKCL